MEPRQKSKTSVLVLEDEPIVAMDIEVILTEAGYDVPATFSSIAKAMDWLGSNVPDVVVLDIGLADGSSVQVARRLLAKAIPFVVFSGTSPREPEVDPVFHAGHWLEKPAGADCIVSAVQRVLPLSV